MSDVLRAKLQDVILGLPDRDGGITDGDMEDGIAQIEQAFADEGYVHTDVREKADKLLQDMINMHANMRHDLVRLGLTYTPTQHVADFSGGKLSKLMTGQEWYDRFEKELAEMNPYHEKVEPDYALAAAKRAAFI